MGLVLSFLQEAFPPKALYSVEQIPNLAGAVVIVTGANTGIGKETAKALLAHNAKVYLACRDPQKAAVAIQDLKEATGNEGIFLPLDLADLNSVKKAAETFLSKETELHVLFNNAGVMYPPTNLLTAQGYDLQFGTNVLGHAYLTKLLLPTLLYTLSSHSLSPLPKGRIINTSSLASTLIPTIDFNTLKASPSRFALGELRLYFQSKLGNAVFSNELARRYGEKGIVSVALNPGNINSDLGRWHPVGKWFGSFVTYHVSLGALTQLWAGTSPEGAEFNGMYLKPWARVGTPNPAALDPKLAEDLWTWIEEQLQDI